MKIMHCVATLDPASGGPARSVPQLALALARLGVQVGVWSSEPSVGERGSTAGILADLEQGAAKRIQVLSGDFGTALAAFGSPDIIHDHGIWLSCHQTVANAARQRSILRVVSPRGMLEPWALNHKKWKKRLAWHLYQRRSLQSAALLHATAGSEAAQLRRLGLSAPVVVVPNGVDLPESCVRPDNQISGAKHPVPQRTALFLSRIQSKKGLPMLIQAWARVRPSGWRMRVVGPDEDGHRAELEDLVRLAGMAADWSFEGPLEGTEKWAAFQSAELFILPTHSENFGIAIAEALAAGVPVITTQGAPWELLEQENCGWWVPVSVDGLAAALDDATRRSPGQLAAMGSKGREIVAQRFGWDRIAGQFIDCYRWVLGGGEKPECVME